MPIFSKPILMLSCITGSACSVGIPLSIYSNQGSDIKNTTSRGGHNLVNQSLGDPKGSPTQDSDEEEEGILLKFDDLGKKINMQYWGEQYNLDTTSQTFSGEKELQNIIESSSKMQPTGKIISQDGKNCKESNNISQNFCGYLEIKNDKDSYKLKILLEDDNGKVTIVKPKGNGIEYYEVKDQHGGKEISDIKFQDLTTFRNSNQGGGEDIKEVSITKPNLILIANNN